MADQRLAEGLPLARPVECVVEAGLRKADRARGHPQALGIEIAHDGAEARVLLADQVGGGHAHIVEMQAGGVRAPPAHLLQLRAREAGPVALDEQQRHSRRAGAARAHRHRVVVGAHAGSDEGLLAADDVVISFLHGFGPQACNIRAATGFRDRKRAYFFTRQDRGQNPALEFLAADRGDRWRADGVGKQARRQPTGAGAREFLCADDAEEVVSRRAAVLLGKSHAKQSGRRGLPVEFAWEFARFVPGRRVRQDLAINEAPDCVTPGLVLLHQRGMRLHAGSNSISRFPGATCAPAVT